MSNHRFMHGCLRYIFDRKLHNAHHPHRLKRNIIWNLNQIINFQVRTVELFKFSRQCRAFQRFLGSLIFLGGAQHVPNSLLEVIVPLLNHMQQDGSTPVFFCSQEFPWFCWFYKPFKKSLETKKATKKTCRQKKQFSGSNTYTHPSDRSIMTGLFTYIYNKTEPCR